MYRVLFNKPKDFNTGIKHVRIYNPVTKVIVEYHSYFLP